MAIFTPPPKRDLPVATVGPGSKTDSDPTLPPVPHEPHTGSPVRTQAAPAARNEYESLIAPDLTVEGKIQGAGHIRIAGRFRGDVQVEGNLTLEPGAKINGAVQARQVTIGGELEGNIEAAKQVELLAGGAIQGDIKAGQVTVAPGARVRGHVDFGWEDSAQDEKVTCHYQPGGAP